MALSPHSPQHRRRDGRAAYRSAAVGATVPNVYVGDFSRASPTSGDYLYNAAPTGLDFTGDLTLESWVRPAATPTGTDIYVIQSRWGVGAGNLFLFDYLLQSGSPALRFAVRGNSSNTSIWKYVTTLSTVSWTHVAVLFDLSEATASQCSFVVNGTDQGSTVVSDGSVSAMNASPSAEYRISAQDASSYSPFNGRLDEVRAWSVLRTAAQVNANKALVLDGATANLEAYIRMENNWNDTTGQNDMTAVNTPTFITGDSPF